MKTCFKCKKELPFTEFYCHPKMADGFLGKCKDCTKADVRARYAVARTQRSEYERRRNQTPERKARQVEYLRRCRKEHPEVFRARNAVNNAVRKGRLLRQPCERCGWSPAEAHHDDYSRPLDVRWLCFRCHREGEHGQTVIVPF